MPQIETKSGASFRLGDWLVEPDRNRISGGDQEVLLEPRVMDLLVFLAEHAGEVVARREIVDAVWQQDFVGDTTLSAAIAVLRRCLGDDAREPRYIETIAKRGYRLVAEVFDPATLATVTPFPGLPAVREHSPYPGLAAFSAAEAADFFGREREVRTLWNAIGRRRLLAVIGPSGVGKTSFVSAGVIPAAPEGWGALRLEPGAAPFDALARCLAPEFAGHVESIQQLVACHDPDVALALVSRWRERWDNALLVVDQAEELFTLTPPGERTAFAELLARLADAAGIHVLLAMRDDFLYDCHAHPGLAPVFSELTVLAPLAAGDLERVLLEPARRSGYRFEDDALAAEMVAEVAGERGATPLLAFAMARLWELRDRQRRLVTRQAYHAIGGVAGALAQHAEEVLAALGDDRLATVRELFRNLVTPQGTRAVRTVDELVAVFPAPARAAASECLQALVRARLLTFFEPDATANAGSPAHHRVEIAHEALLTGWPRLVRWRTQDADAAQLRDQLRRAARLWHEHGRSADLLWTGTAFRELGLWRERFPGGLSEPEKAFFAASARLAGRHRRRRRLAAAGLLVALLAVATLVTGLWRRSVRQARRAEARQLYHLGQLILPRYPSGALHRALASLELADNPDARRLALRALWAEPWRLVPGKAGGDIGYPTAPQFSSDGRWLATGYWSGEIAVWPATGGDPVVWQAHASPSKAWFADPSTLVSVSWADPAYRVWSVPAGTLLAEILITGWRPPAGGDWQDIVGNVHRVLPVAPLLGDGPTSWRVDPRYERALAWLLDGGCKPGVVDPSGELLAYGDAGSLWLTRIDALDASDAPPPARLGDHASRFVQLAFSHDGSMLATVDAGGSLQLWATSTDGSAAPLRAWPGETVQRCGALAFAPSDRYILLAQGDGVTRVHGIDDPTDAEPRHIRGDYLGASGMAFDPTGRWLATASPRGVALRPFDPTRHAIVLRGHAASVDDLAFAPDGSWLVSASSDGTVRLWPLAPAAGDESRVLVQWGAAASFEGLVSVAVAPDGRAIATAIGGADTVRLVTPGGALLHELALPRGDVHALAFGPNSDTVAVGLVAPAHGPDAGAHLTSLTVLLWRPETSEVEPLDASVVESTFQGLGFTRDGSLLVAGSNGLFRWPRGASEPEQLSGDIQTFAICPGSDVMVAAHGGDTGWTASVDDLAGGTSRPLRSHDPLDGNFNLDTILAVDRDCRLVVSAHDTEIRVGSNGGAPPHLLLGHDDEVRAVAVSPDGRRVASASRDATIRLWPMPDPAATPFHTLPRAELLERLRGMTLTRWVRDPASPEGFAFQRAPFPGWETMPEW